MYVTGLKKHPKVITSIYSRRLYHSLLKTKADCINLCVGFAIFIYFLGYFLSAILCNR